MESQQLTLATSADGDSPIFNLESKTHGFEGLPVLRRDHCYDCQMGTYQSRTRYLEDYPFEKVHAV